LLGAVPDEVNVPRSSLPPSPGSTGGQRLHRRNAGSTLDDRRNIPNTRDKKPLSHKGRGVAPRAGVRAVPLELVPEILVGHLVVELNLAGLDERAKQARAALRGGTLEFGVA